MEGEDDADERAEQHAERQGARAGLVEVAQRFGPTEAGRAKQAGE